MIRTLFIEDTKRHQADVKKIVFLAARILELNCAEHDADKIIFANKLTNDADALQLWKDIGFEQHKSIAPMAGSTHHKENVQDLFDVIEMLADWIAAGHRRNGAATDPNHLRIPKLDWEKLLQHTYELIYLLVEDNSAEIFK